MRMILRNTARRLLGGVFGFLRLNYFVYVRSLSARVSWPDIPVRNVELYGQCGEDLILVALLRAKALARNVDLKTQKYLEVGGNHPFATSPTYLMQRQLGMSGVIVEANPALLSDIRKGRPRDTVVHGAVQADDVDTVTLTVSKLSEISSLNSQWVDRWADGKVGAASQIEVPALRMNHLVSDFMGDQAPCFLSTDVETLDLTLLQDFDFDKYRPWFVQAEPSEKYSLGETERMIDHMRSVDYALVAQTNVNLIFADTRQ